MQKSAIILAVNNPLEQNIALVYKSVYLGEMATVLKRLNWNPRIVDVLFGGFSMFDLFQEYFTEPDLLLIYADVHQSKQVLHLAKLAKKLSPRSKLLVYGRATAIIPQYFFRPPFDAVHISGDREMAVSQFIRYLETGDASILSGITLVHEDGSLDAADKSSPVDI
jgi:hypothetical protein